MKLKKSSFALAALLMMAAACQKHAVVTPAAPTTSIRSQTIPMLLTVGAELKPGEFVDVPVPTSPAKDEFITGVAWFPDQDKPEAHSRTNLVYLETVTAYVGQDQGVHLGVLTAAGAPISTKVRIVVEVRSLQANR